MGLLSLGLCLTNVQLIPIYCIPAPAQGGGGDRGTQTLVNGSGSGASLVMGPQAGAGVSEQSMLGTAGASLPSTGVATSPSVEPCVFAL